MALHVEPDERAGDVEAALAELDALAGWLGLAEVAVERTVR